MTSPSQILPIFPSPPAASPPPPRYRHRQAEHHRQFSPAKSRDCPVPSISISSISLSTRVSPPPSCPLGSLSLLSHPPFAPLSLFPLFVADRPRLLCHRSPTPRPAKTSRNYRQGPDIDHSLSHPLTTDAPVPVPLHPRRAPGRLFGATWRFPPSTGFPSTHVLPPTRPPSHTGPSRRVSPSYV